MNSGKRKKTKLSLGPKAWETSSAVKSVLAEVKLPEKRKGKLVPSYPRGRLKDRR